MALSRWSFLELLWSYHDMKLCKGPCGLSKPETSFEKMNGGPERRSTCRKCREEGRAANPDSTHIIYTKNKKKRYAQSHVANKIVSDSKRSDKLNGREGFDLTVEFVSELIVKGCCYCGETGLRMSVDRIDNDLAHTCANANPACIRCNYVRGSMPYAAWMLLVPAVKRARELGLFGQWRSQPMSLGDKPSSRTSHATAASESVPMNPTTY